MKPYTKVFHFSQLMAFSNCSIVTLTYGPYSRHPSAWMLIPEMRPVNM